MKPYKIAEGVYQIGGPRMTAPEDCCVYLVDGGGEMAVIDAGLGFSAPKLVDNIKALAKDPGAVKYLVATHGHVDHTGGLAYLKETLKAQVVVHRYDQAAVEGQNPVLTAADYYGVEYRPVKADIVLGGEEEALPLGGLQLVLLLTPGHTPGSMSLYVDTGGQMVLFGQDIHGPFDPAWSSDLEAWRKSMRRLLALKADVLCEGHFGVFQPASEVESYIRGYLDYYSKR